MLSKFFTPIFLIFGIFIGAQVAKTTSNEQAKEVDFFKFEKKFAATIIEKLPWSLNSKYPQIRQPSPIKLPIAEFAQPPTLKIKAGISADENNFVYYEKNINEKLPIASLTKIITALTVLENLNPNDTTTISKTAVSAYGETGGLVINEEISIKNLLYIMLIDSSNDAAIALAEALAQKNKDTVALMNEKAKTLGLTNSFFSDPAGLNSNNFSTASDLLKLTNIALQNELIREIISIEEIDVFSENKKTKHHLKNTNKLLGKIDEIIGGKTGYTEEAGECLILIAEHKPSKKYFIAIVLGAGIGERFIEAEKLIDWTKEVYRW